MSVSRGGGGRPGARRRAVRARHPGTPLARVVGAAASALRSRTSRWRWRKRCSATSSTRPSWPRSCATRSISRFRSSGSTTHLQVVELFHGPTFAFKDVGARTLARLLALSERDVAAGDGTRVEGLTVLVATSGDTGSAVAQAFWGVPRHARGRAVSGGPGQPGPGGAVHDPGRQRHRRRRGRHLRRLPAPGEGGVCRPRPAAARAADLGQLHQPWPARSADVLLRVCGACRPRLDRTSCSRCPAAISATWPPA